MPINYPQTISSELNIPLRRVEAVIKLLDGEATIPFIARYRKEMTGNLDEVAITSVRDRLLQLRELDQRRDFILQSIDQQGKLTEVLKEKIQSALTMAALEDIYLPYRPKRRTRASAAKEKGLEPLAQKIFEQKGIDPEKEAALYVNPSVEKDKIVADIHEALSGARDIMAEWINEDSAVRSVLRDLLFKKGKIASKASRGKEVEADKYKDYFQWEESLRKAPSHRVLAVFRGEKEKLLSVTIVGHDEEMKAILEKQFVKGEGADSLQVKMACEDSFKRLLFPSLAAEARVELKKRADQEAVEIFKGNLRELLMAPSLGQKNVLAIDPGYRSGCKVVCLNPEGKLIAHDTIFITNSQKEKEKAQAIIHELVKRCQSEVIAIGNGTASRETESFIKGLGLPQEIQIVVVSESGASIYSASEIAREEFGDYDVTVRGAVSIGRRLMDPLAELVKIDPKSIGVGQYQYDVDQTLLKKSLDEVVISCVNQVGVVVNTASIQLLSYVSGLGPVRARAIVDYRNASGMFHSREDIKKVSGLGPKAFEQAAGFLRIYNADNPLDASGVHPESYALIDRIAKEAGCSIKDLLRSPKAVKKIDWTRYVSPQVGLPTLMDIKEELARPGRDPRPAFQLFHFDDDITQAEDLKPGMKLRGVVTNITAFGVFVDIGVHLDGLVHISQLSERYVSNPREVVKLHQQIIVKVVEVDLKRRRIALTMIDN